MITDVENIILNKEYFELTPEELESVNELVQNAEEYDEMKWFLASTHEVLVTDKIEATPELKEKVMAHLHQDASNRKFWLNGVVVFLWPTDKEVYRRPAFQMSLAALLLIGFIMVTNRDLQPEEGGMAINDVIETEEIYESTDNRDEDDKIVLSEEEVETKSDELADGEVAEIDELLKAEEKSSDRGPQLDQPLDEIVFADDADMELEPTVTDADGFYVAPSMVEEERVDNSVSNANNNESNLGGNTGKEGNGNSNGYKSVLENQDKDDRNKDNESKPEKKEKFKSRDESRKNKLEKSNNSQTEDIVLEDFDQSYGNMYEPRMDTTTLTLSSNRVNTGSDINTSGTVNDPGNVSTITESSAKPNGGGMNVDGNSDIIPNQMSVSQTGELKKLFKTFK